VVVLAGFVPLAAVGAGRPPGVPVVGPAVFVLPPVVGAVTVGLDVVGPAVVVPPPVVGAVTVGLDVVGPAVLVPLTFGLFAVGAGRLAGLDAVAAGALAGALAGAAALGGGLAAGFLFLSSAWANNPTEHNMMSISATKRTQCPF
jgi:hypothetical protein